MPSLTLGKERPGNDSHGGRPGEETYGGPRGPRIAFLASSEYGPVGR